jgi:tetraacyldisaccharide 4'-kinase
MAQAGVQAVVMDDGHQNPSLIKALSLVVIDAGAPFGNGHVFPKGKLREPVAAGLARADGVILMGEGEVSGLPGLRDRVPVLRAWLEGVGAVPEGPLVAFAGIGRPQKVFDALEADGAELVEAVAFDDHHAFTPGDLAYVSRLAQERGARLITTAKDVVRLPSEFRARVLVREVRVAWGEGDAGRLDALLAGVVPGSA